MMSISAQDIFIPCLNQHAPRLKDPVVRLTIDDDRKASLYGRKNMNENLRELKLHIYKTRSQIKSETNK